MNNILISNFATLGSNCKIHPFTQICDGAVVGDNTTIGHNVFIGENVKIGSNCKIQGNVFIPEGIEIEDDVFIGPGTTFCNVKYPGTKVKNTYEKTIVCYNTTIGANCTILPGLTIGNNCILGAGSVLTRDMHNKIKGYGNPAKFII